MLLNNILLSVDNVLQAVVYLLASFALFAIGKYAYKVVHKGVDVDHELVEKDNLAFAVSQVGYYIGLLLVIGGTLVGESHNLVYDLMNMGLYGFAGITLLNLGLLINDKLILPKFKVKKEIVDDQNVGTGVVEAAVAIGTGLVIYGALTVEESYPPFTLLYFAIGQLLFVLTSKVYNMILPYDIHDHIEKDNVAVGIGFAGALIAVANIVRAGISNDFEEWDEFAMIILFEAVIGVILLPVVRVLTDKLLLPKRKLTDEIVNQEEPNNGAALIEAFAYIGGSILITWCL